MPQNQPLVFSNIAPAQFSALVAKAKASGVELVGNSGTASRYGVEISWNYVPESQQLTFQCLKTPFFVNAADVHAKLKTLVDQSLAAL
ncbi:MAG: hypothetical protein WCA11_07540 [Terracidiphilus sp.]